MSQREIKTTWAKSNWADKAVPELKDEIKARKSKSFDLRVDKATGKLTDFREIQRNRKRIAILQTLINQKGGK